MSVSIIDGHLDLAFNALVNGRNLQQPLPKLREQEKGRHPAGIATLTLPALKEAHVTVVFGTLFAPPADRRLAKAGGHTPKQFQKMAMDQLDYYHRLADEDETIRLIRSKADLAAVLAAEKDEERPLLGIVPLLKGADPIVEPAALEQWIERGVHIVGLAWDDTAYASGFQRGSRTGLTKSGYQLLEMMADFHLIADLSHLNEKASLEILDSYPGPLIASHSNVRALLSDSERHLSDRQIRLIGERNGIIGISPYNPFLRRGHRHGEPKESATIDDVVAHIDFICQILGSAANVGLGSGLDGLFGAADLPQELDTVADLARIGTALRSKGYDDEAVTAVLGKNWAQLLGQTLPT